MEEIRKIVLTVVAILLLFVYSLVLHFAFGVQRSKSVINEYNDVIESYEDEFVNSELEKPDNVLLLNSEIESIKNLIEDIQ